MEDVETQQVIPSAAVSANRGVAATGSPPVETGSRTVAAVLGDLLRHPGRNLLSKWNWKSAVLSSVLRAAIFFSTNLVAGWHAALGAMGAELALRSVTSGF